MNYILKKRKTEGEKIFFNIQLLEEQRGKYMGTPYMGYGLAV